MPDVSSLQKNASSIFSRVYFVLEKTSHSGNVGASARALKTMGFHNLVLISPKKTDILSSIDACVRSARGIDILKNAKIMSDFHTAMKGIHYCVGLSSRRRNFNNVFFTPREAANLVISRLMNVKTEKLAFVFGNEQNGLSNEILSNCQEQWCIPSSEVYSSLNLASAVQIVAYEVRMAILQGVSALSDSLADQEKRHMSHFSLFCGQKYSSARTDDLICFFNRMNKLLEKIGFNSLDRSKKGWLRLRQSFLKANFTRENVFLLQGVLKKIERYICNEVDAKSCHDKTNENQE